MVNLIHSYTDNGDPFVRKFTDELLEEVSHSADHWICTLTTFSASGFSPFLCYSAQVAIFR